MSEKESASIRETCEIYKQLPDYLKGKLDGYAEAVKECRSKGETGEANPNA